MFTIDDWGNVTINIHLDALIGFILFLVLGLGVFGFIFKNVLIEFFVLSK